MTNSMSYSSKPAMERYDCTLHWLVCRVFVLVTPFENLSNPNVHE